MLRATLLLVALAILSSGCDDKKGTLPSTTSTTPSASAPTVAPETASTPSAAPVPPKEAHVPNAIAAQHVLVAYKGAKNAPKTVTRSKADARTRAEEVANKAKTSSDFSALVAEYSDDPAAKERQGSVGKFTRDKMTKPFSDAAFALAVDETSGPVESDFGFHVIRRNQ